MYTSPPTDTPSHTYPPPKKHTGQGYSFGADIWAFGLSILACALGAFPLEESTHEPEKGGGYWGLVHAVCESPAPALPETFTPAFRSFVGRCVLGVVLCCAVLCWGLDGVDASGPGRINSHPADQPIPTHKNTIQVPGEGPSAARLLAGAAGAPLHRLAAPPPQGRARADRRGRSVRAPKMLVVFVCVCVCARAWGLSTGVVGPVAGSGSSTH